MEASKLLYSVILVVLLAILVTSFALNVQLRTRPSDGAALCALDPPTVNVTAASNMAGAPPSVLCTMSSTNNAGCKHFNYMSREPLPCQLYNYKPIDLRVKPNCQHYETPGDLEACAINNGGCDSNAICTNVVGGGVTCQCDQCYVGDGQTCSLIAKPDCSLPFTYEGSLHYSCVANMANVATAEQPFACLHINSTPVVCECQQGYVAQELTVYMTISTTSVALKSVFGWLIVQHRVNYIYIWNRLWAEYKSGFGDIAGDFWLGLENIHLLTVAQSYRLRVEVQERSSNLWYSAEYWYFMLGDEADGYRLEVTGYSGDAGNGLQYEGDMYGMGNFGFAVHDGMKFTTSDVDNDVYPTNCASVFGGPWWFKRCYWVCLMCNYDNFAWYLLPTPELATSRMMIQPQ